MVSVASPLRRSRLKELLEDLGFDMNALPEAARHQMLKPVGLRSYGLRETQPDERGIRRGPEIVEGNDYFSWVGNSAEDADPAETRGCLWDFINAAEAPGDQVIAFVQRWGLFEKPFREDGAGYWSVEEFRDAAMLIRAVLVTLVATEAAELIDELTLKNLARLQPYFDMGRPGDADEVLRRLGLEPGGEYNIPEHISYLHFDQIRWERWRAERAAGVGIELQARLIAAILNSYAGSNPGTYLWDERGRRFERVAVGVSAICWSHLAALFSSTVLDVFLCAVCGKPFEFDTRTLMRRPRSGKRRFCGDACRLEAKKQSNRESWRRNSARWRPPKRKADGSTR